MILMMYETSILLSCFY